MLSVVYTANILLVVYPSEAKTAVEEIPTILGYREPPSFCKRFSQKEVHLYTGSSPSF